MIFSQGMLPLKESIGVRPLSQSKGIFPPIITQKNWLASSNNRPQKRKNEIGNSSIIGLMKKKISTGLDKITFRVLLETLKFRLITALRALNHWSTDQMIPFINQYWWGNINKATKRAYSLVPLIQIQTGKPVCTDSRYFKQPNEPFNFWQMVFIQLHLSNVYKYLLIMVCVFSLSKNLPLQKGY